MEHMMRDLRTCLGVIAGRSAPHRGMAGASGRISPSRLPNQILRDIVVSVNEQPMAWSDAAETARLVRGSVMRLARRLRAQRPQNGVSLTKLSLLARLHHGGAMTPGTLAAVEHVQIQSLTRALAELQRDRLVARSRHPTDRRQALLTITPAGRETLLADMRTREAWLARAMTDLLSSTEREFLRLAAQLMERLADE
jgi:DNA-binding MarR family transcriptional regulator